MNQSNQFVIGTTYTQESFDQASATYLGEIPDPVSGNCVRGTQSGSDCTGSCSQSEIETAFLTGARFFYSTGGSCGPQPGVACVDSVWKTCGDGGSDHCFSIKNCQDCCGGGDCGSC